MSYICFEHVNKFFGENHVLKDISLSVEQGELVTFLGPSGCGKSTLLRCLSGLETVTDGKIFLDGKDVTDVEPKKRGVGMVFQQYSLFPNLTVGQNVAFGLKIQKRPKQEIAEKVRHMLEIVGLAEKTGQYPSQLSGGQQQRVALARALAIEPEVLLMDEPLSNLDAKLRVEMREVIKEIQNSLGITTVYVTHDQEEAMAVSDRIAVMNAGVIQQIGSPKSLYQRPANLFVSTFIGRTNLLKATVVDNGGGIRFKDGLSLPMDNLTDDAKDGQEVIVSIRPEEFVIEEAGQEGLPATVAYNIFLGLNTHYFVDLADGERVEIIQESRIEEILKSGTPIKLGIKREKINVFTQDGSRSVIK